MNFSKNTKLAAIATAALIVTSQIVFVSITQAANPKPTVLCVKPNGQILAKSKCQKGETRFSLFPTQVKQKPIKETLLGKPRTIPSITKSTTSTSSTLSILESTPRVFTSLVTLGTGTTIGNQRNFSNSMPSCPAEAPLRTGWFAILASDPATLGVEGEIRISSENNAYRVEIDNIQGDREFTRFKPSLEISNSGISNTLRIDIQSESGMNEPVRFFTSYGDYSETYDLGGYDPTKPNNNLLESVKDITTLDVDISFYVSVSCIPLVTLTP